AHRRAAAAAAPRRRRAGIVTAIYWRHGTGSWRHHLGVVGPRRRRCRDSLLSRRADRRGARTGRRDRARTLRPQRLDPRLRAPPGGVRLPGGRRRLVRARPAPGRRTHTQAAVDRPHGTTLLAWRSR